MPVLGATRSKGKSRATQETEYCEPTARSVWSAPALRRFVSLSDLILARTTGADSDAQRRTPNAFALRPANSLLQLILLNKMESAYFAGSGNPNCAAISASASRLRSDSAATGGQAVP